jgi:predicted pyridoxine 5'-phosphate oxidase superfamily flavin-nucleotide-binding protein
MADSLFRQIINRGGRSEHRSIVFRAGRQTQPGNIMAYGFLDTAITGSVRAVQAREGVDHLWRDFKGHREFDRFTNSETSFIAERDSFYIATVSESGWPYLQHRGGPKGFLKLLDDRTLAFADYRGNRQYISAGNLEANDRACLFLMDYAHRARLKIYAHVSAHSLDAEPEVAAALRAVPSGAKVERIFRLRLQAFDWNCPQHITPRFTEMEIAQALDPLHEKLALLEAENAALRKQGRSAAPGSPL